MRTIEQTLELQADAAIHKIEGMRHPLRFTVSGMLAGAYVGIGIRSIVSAAGGGADS